MLGYTQAEVLGRSPLDFVAETHREHFAEQMRLRRTGDRQHYEMIWRAKSGEEVNTLVAPSPLFDDHGAFCGAFAVITDLTTQKRIERALSDERSRLEAIMEHLPDAVYVKDMEGRYTAANRAKVRNLGKTCLEGVLNKTVFDFYPPEAAARFHDQDLHVARTGEAMLNILESVGKGTGEVLWELTSKAPVRDALGVLVGMVGVSRDVTQERRALEALAASEERFREILEQSRDIAYKVDVCTGRFIYVSPSTAALLGITPEELQVSGPARVLAMLHPGDRARFEAYGQVLLDHVRRGAAPPACEYRLRRNDGVYRWFSESASLTVDAGGRPAARIGTLRDITEAKQAEETFRAASRMEATATLAGGIAHDFNNLMAAVLGNAELIEMKLPKDSELTRKLDAICTAAVQAGKLAQQMLAFAQGGKYQPATVHLNELIENVLGLEQSSFPPELRVERNLAPELWSTLADRTQLGQVILNLTLNAVESISGAGTVTLSTGNRSAEEADTARLSGLVPGRYVHFAVSDTGHGMPPEICARVFEPFFTTRFQGRGLGLAAAYGIVKNHGGHIFVSSTPGAGSLFEVWLPASDLDADAPECRAKNLPVGHETVLIADDEESLLLPTREMLERMGYTVLVARDGAEAIETIRAHNPPIHLVLLDMAMPGMGGAEAFGIIMKLRPRIKVIVWSGYDIGPDIQRMLDAGAHGFLHKPVRAAELAAELRRVLDN